jgi:hypothetical protein
MAIAHMAAGPISTHTASITIFVWPSVNIQPEGMYFLSQGTIFLIALFTGSQYIYHSHYTEYAITRPWI